MSNVRTLTRSFSGGVVTPEFFGRTDDAKYLSGIAKCEHLIVLPHGPAHNRAGFGFVRKTKRSAFGEGARLIPFTYSDTQTMCIEMGAGYFRFHTAGGTLLDAGVPYEVVNTYLLTELADVHYTQSADVLTLTHAGHPPRELRRLGATNWTLTVVDFSPLPSYDDLGGGAGISATYAGGSNLYTYRYRWTIAELLGSRESKSSGPLTISGNLNSSGGHNDLSFDLGAPAAGYTYRVYKEVGGLYGYIGQTEEATFVDDNIAPDLGHTPPIYSTNFDGADNYPRAVGYFEQRRVFAGSNNKPQTVWMTRSGTESDMSSAIPTKDDDAITFRIASREANSIQHIVPMADLVLLTGAGEWRISTQNSEVLTPTTVSARPQGYVGANRVQPILIGNAAVYAASRGGHMRELAYQWEANGYQSGDLSMRAPHLFDGSEIVDLAYQKAPYPIVWAASSNGNLLGLTYLPEQQVGAWHTHPMPRGEVTQVCVVVEGDEDALYAVVRRTVDDDADPSYCIERMSKRSDGIFLDSHVVGAIAVPTNTVSGLDHLVGHTVTVVANGVKICTGVVDSDGEVSTGDVLVSGTVAAGLAIPAVLETLPCTQERIAAGGAGRAKAVNKAWVRMYQSDSINIGPSADEMTPYTRVGDAETWEQDILVPPSWTEGGQILIKHDEPTPFTLLSVSLEVAIGG